MTSLPALDSALMVDVASRRLVLDQQLALAYGSYVIYRQRLQPATARAAGGKLTWLPGLVCQSVQRLIRRKTLIFVHILPAAQVFDVSRHTSGANMSAKLFVLQSTLPSTLTCAYKTRGLPATRPSSSSPAIDTDRTQSTIIAHHQSQAFYSLHCNIFSISRTKWP